MNQKHLIPAIVIDCVESMNNRQLNINVRNNFEDRVKAIRDYCEEELKKMAFIKRGK